MRVSYTTIDGRMQFTFEAQGAIAILSGKGQSTAAARRFVASPDVPALTLYG
jgi:hypothetical protein